MSKSPTRLYRIGVGALVALVLTSGCSASISPVTSSATGTVADNVALLSVSGVAPVPSSPPAPSSSSISPDSSAASTLTPLTVVAATPTVVITTTVTPTTSVTATATNPVITSTPAPVTVTSTATAAATTTTTTTTPTAPTTVSAVAWCFKPGNNFVGDYRELFHNGTAIVDVSWPLNTANDDNGYIVFWNGGLYLRTVVNGSGPEYGTGTIPGAQGHQSYDPFTYLQGLGPKQEGTDNYKQFYSGSGQIPKSVVDDNTLINTYQSIYGHLSKYKYRSTEATEIAAFALLRQMPVLWPKVISSPACK